MNLTRNTDVQDALDRWAEFRVQRQNYSSSFHFCEGEGYWALTTMGSSIIAQIMLEYYDDNMAGGTNCYMSSSTAGSRGLASSSRTSCLRSGRIGLSTRTIRTRRRGRTSGLGGGMVPEGSDWEWDSLCEILRRNCAFVFYRYVFSR